jgi:hypothetical protein
MVGKLALLIAVTGLGLVLSVGAAHAAPTKSEFIRQGDALCLQVQRDLAPLVRRAQAAKSLPESQQWAAAQRLWADQIRIQARFTARLRAVGVPTGDSKARSIVLGLDRGLVLAAACATLLRGEVPLLWPLRCRSTSASRCRSTAASRRTASRSAAIPEPHVIEPD